MDRTTVDIYDERGMAWVRAHRDPRRRAEAEAFAARVPVGALRIDMGCGGGRYTPLLGTPTVAFDASRAMLDECRSLAPDALALQGDVEALPFADRSLGGAWSWMTYLHVPRPRLPLALRDLHRALAVGAPLEVQVLEGTYEGHALEGDDVGGRFFAGWEARALAEVVTGAGFDVDSSSVEVSGDELRLRAVRARTLADTVGPGMRLLVVGLNPSLVAADAGYGFAGPTNRFWKVALAAGLVDRARDPLHALRTHGVGMTDQVKRATRAAGELTAAEYRAGAQRLERLVAWLRPATVCFVGLAGWRAAGHPRAAAGVQPEMLGGRPVYVMPSTSGLNARSSLDELTTHLRAALALADRSADAPGTDAPAAGAPPSAGASVTPIGPA